MTGNEKQAYRTTMPFDGGLSPPTEKSRVVPWAGGGILDDPRRNFDKNVGGDHKFTNPRPDGTDYAISTLFAGELERDPKAGPYETEVVVTDAEGKSHVYRDRGYDMVLMEWRGKPYHSITRRLRRASNGTGMVKLGAEDVPLVAMVANLLPACFKVESESYTYGKKEIGSCFAVGEDAFLTCAHVISKRGEDPSKVAVYLVEHGRRFKAVPVDVDYDMDLAVLRCGSVRHSVLQVKSARGVPVGEDIVCVGSPYGYDNNVTRGIVSSKGRKITGTDGVGYLFMDLSVYPGSSGGPVVDARDGKVIGIAAIIVQSVGNYGLNAAIPIDYAAERFPEHVEGRS